MTTNSNDQILFERNISTYLSLFKIENFLREFIIEEMNKAFGPFWYKSHLTSTALDKYKDGRKYEQSIKWFTLIPHHPIYYIDFGSLKEIISRNDNWDGAFKSIFVKKDLIITLLSELEYIRNKVAHNRIISDNEQQAICLALNKIECLLGSERIKIYSAKFTHACNIKDRFNLLYIEASTCISICLRYDPLSELINWNFVKKQWWFDESYLCNNITNISNYFCLIEAYKTLPRARGQGHRIEAWVNEHDIKSYFTKAKQEFSNLIEVKGD